MNKNANHQIGDIVYYCLENKIMQYGAIAKIISSDIVGGVITIKWLSTPILNNPASKNTTNFYAWAFKKIEEVKNLSQLDQSIVGDILDI